MPVNSKTTSNTYRALCMAAAITSFFSFGSISLILLFILLFIDHGTGQEKLKRTVNISVFIHLAAIGFLIYKLTLVFGGDVSPQSLFGFLLSHWVIDYFSELTVGIMLTVSVIKSNKNNKQEPRLISDQ